jgi:hypothetical protein
MKVSPLITLLLSDVRASPVDLAYFAHAALKRLEVLTAVRRLL